MKRLLMALIPALLVLVTGAGALAQYSSDPSATIMVKHDKKLGDILADSKGMTVYLFTNDTKENESTCTDKCATFWPPVTATGDVTLASGVEGTLATFKRADGTMQVSYNGIPLYYYAKDKDAEDAYGQNVGGIWFVVKPGAKFGEAKPIAPIVTVKKDEKLGSILADSKGMTLYLFTKDTKENESTCVDKCATSWPPLTVKSSKDVLVAGQGASGKLATFKRADGTLQVSYNGIPLYYFAKDKDKEDAYGQGVGKVWYVVAPDAKFGASPTASPEASPSSSPAAATSAGTAVTIANFAFDAPSVTIKVGSSVTWTNNDSVAHTVTADDGSFDSGNLDAGKTFSFTFTKAGTFTYHCAIHPNMTGTIVVQ
jgi:predicted lipoprotein with Yx(FWY)xxD motif/plastocyanin